MKKTLLILTVMLSMSTYFEAQVNPNAIGIRFGGDGRTNGAELSYQKGFGSKNRLELDFGFKGRKYYNNFFMSATYQWDFNIVGGLNWYIGPGACLGFYSWDDGNYRTNGVNLGLGGQVGLEYNFNKHGVPILISIDARPMFDFVGYIDGFGWGSALGIRYTW